MWPSPGTMLSRNAITGRMAPSRAMMPLAFSGAPQSLQKPAPSTSIGNPHREQKRGWSKNSASGTEGKRSVSHPHRVSIAQGSLVDSLAAYEGPILTPQVAQAKAAVAGLERCMMARDRRVVQNDIVV